MKIYGDLTPWYRVLDPYEDHLEEALAFAAAIDARAEPRAETLLELGAGAGHNGYHLKRRFRCTFSDLSPAMLELSRELNPECEHVLGDMRTLRLGRTFDAVLVHDAIGYMTREADLRAALETAAVHTRPGGVALFVPDCFRDEFEECAELLVGARGDRALRGVEWCWDPDPSDDTIQVEFVLALRHGLRVETVHDTHTEGLFARATWRRLLADLGLVVEEFEPPLGDGATDRVFACRKPR